MIEPSTITAERLLVVADCERIVPHVQRAFAPIAVAAADDYLAGIAELGVPSTRAAVLGIDPSCRRFERAIAALRDAAGTRRLILCCEPIYEPLARRLRSDGLDDYVLFPPTPLDLERALQLPSRPTIDRWLGADDALAGPAPDELQRLAELLPRITAGGPNTLNDLAGLIAAAMHAASAMIVVDGRVGSVGQLTSELIDRATLTQDIPRHGRASGQIRLGPSLTGVYDRGDARRLRQYAALAATLLDVAERTARWQEYALTDDLTGLANRRRLMEILDELLPRAERDQMPVTLLLFDIDDFKQFNDRHGHDAGDEIIRETAQLFASCCRKHDIVCRYGGDEFVVVFWDPAGPRTAGSQHPLDVIGILTRFREMLARHRFAYLGPNSDGPLTCSGGLARFPWQARTARELLIRADEALYEAKRAGKNRFWLVGSGDVCQPSQLPEAP
ncbi:MAG: GGDEF domain-containing protein [Phycisphaerae bacterium]|nr:GGDEF domain-containing protein [Phycisphaerae bacterium]